MWLQSNQQTQYRPISKFESEDEGDLNAPGDHAISTKYRVLVLIFTCSLCAVIGFRWGHLYHNPLSGDEGYHAHLSSPQCTNPSVRREWRSLSHSEKKLYIRAVKCLTMKSTQLRPEGVMYDDFPYIHNKIGNYSHGAAAFLPWHRYLLHIYERTLRDQCGFSGSLTYWDWTLDWEDLAHSPVFSSEHGFGGDGDSNGAHSVGGGHCVTSGPFADLKLPFFNGDDHEHCLSRGFQDKNGTVGRISGDDVRPSTIEEILRESNYEAFYLALEHKSHNAIPAGVGGDFIKFTAPNDPLFFLHHSQLDRIWWIWQHADQRKRLRAYSGIARQGSGERASLEDVLPMGELAEDWRVVDVMSTQSDLLCYRY